MTTSARASAGSIDLSELARPAAAVHRARPSRSATTRRCCSATRPSADSKGNPTGNWQRGQRRRHPRGPEQRGQPVIGPGERRRRSDIRNFLHVNPYPNTAAPGQNPTECEAGNEPYAVGRQVIGNVPGNQGIKTEDQIGFQLRKGGGG